MAHDGTTVQDFDEETARQIKANPADEDLIVLRRARNKRKKFGTKIEEKQKIQKIKDANKLTRARVRGRPIVQELSRQALIRRGGGVGTLLSRGGTASKAPSIATTGTTLLRTS